jgi:hypothetical protein
MDANIRTIQRAVKPLRTRMVASALATVRIEPEPIEQLQIDFATKSVLIGGVSERNFVFVATLGFWSRCFRWISG